VRPVEILIEHKMGNPQTSPLREALTRVAGK